MVKRRARPPRSWIGALAWLVAAGTAAASAIVSVSDPDGWDRVAALLRAAPAATQVAAVPLPPADDGMAAEIARLKNETRLLALEKKALAIRLALVSEEAGTLTGSIPAGADAPAPSGAAVEEASPDASELSDPSVLASEVAGVPARVRAAGNAGAARFSLQLDRASSLEEARRIWGGLKETSSEALAGLDPLVAMDDRDPDRLWLMAGSFEEESAAGTRCALLTLSGRTCTVTDREGRPLPLP